MGIDAEFYVKPTAGFDRDAYARLELWCSDPARTIAFYRLSVDCDNPPMIGIWLLDRYYGPGYERGPWPELRAFGDELAVHVGETAEVFCSGDHVDSEDSEPWATARAENEEHWQRVGHLPYRNHFGMGCDCPHCESLTAPKRMIGGAQ